MHIRVEDVIDNFLYKYPKTHFGLVESKTRHHCVKFHKMMISCILLLTVLLLGDSRSSPTVELISFGKDINDLLVEEFFIPKPKPADTKRKGKTAAGLDCFCLKDSGSIYLPPIINEECICKKNCCKNRPPNHYLPPDDCEICPNCICDTQTYTLIHEESGNCPLCRPPPLETKCECRDGKYINEELGNCPKPCNPSPCRCINGHYVNELSGNCPAVCVPPPTTCECRDGRLHNEKSGNCPTVCEPPPCLCVSGQYINKESGNCPARCDPLSCVCRNGRLVNTDSGSCPSCLPNCSCYKGKLINKDRGICPTLCPSYDEKPEGYAIVPEEIV